MANEWLDSETNPPLGPLSKAVRGDLAAIILVAAAWFLSTLDQTAAIIAGGVAFRLMAFVVFRQCSIFNRWHVPSRRAKPLRLGLACPPRYAVAISASTRPTLIGRRIHRDRSREHRWCAVFPRGN